MQLRKLGGTAELVSAIAQGTTGFGTRELHDANRVSARVAAIRAGIDMGITFVDTAELYGAGFSEECLGPALCDIRSRIFLASKFNAEALHTGKSLRRSLDGSLMRLRTDWIDLYQIHFPNPLANSDEIYDALLAAKKDGKIRHIGVSNFAVPDLIGARRALGDKLVSVQCEYNASYRNVENDVLPYCTSNCITMLAYSPLGQGTLGSNRKLGVLLIDLSRKYGQTPQQILLAWTIRHNCVVAITKSSNTEHQRQNAEAGDLALDGTDIQTIAEAAFVETLYVNPKEIFPDALAGKAIYPDIAAARANTLSLSPSPEQIALHGRLTNTWKPLKVVVSARPGYRYQFASYDHFGELRKYWAWILEFGYDRPMPVVDVSPSNDRTNQQRPVNKR